MKIYSIPKEFWENTDEPCPVCKENLSRDPVGGFYLKCFKCGWKGW